MPGREQDFDAFQHWICAGEYSTCLMLTSGYFDMYKKNGHALGTGGQSMLGSIVLKSAWLDDLSTKYSKYGFRRYYAFAVLSTTQEPPSRYNLQMSAIGDWGFVYKSRGIFWSEIGLWRLVNSCCVIQWGIAIQFSYILSIRSTLYNVKNIPFI